MKKKKNVEEMKREYERIKNYIKGIGFILRGTIIERVIVRDNKRQPGKERKFGPYYQWTFKREKKTVTINLSQNQAKEYSKAIKNHRKILKLIEKMERLSLEILEATTEGVKRRKTHKYF